MHDDLPEATGPQESSLAPISPLTENFDGLAEILHVGKCRERRAVTNQGVADATTLRGKIDVLRKQRDHVDEKLRTLEEALEILESLG
jgi:hypothetical protein